MTRSFYVDPDEELQLLAEEQEAQARIPIEGIPEQALDPETEGKAGPAFVEQQEEQIDRASLPIWHPDFDSGIAGYESPFTGFKNFSETNNAIVTGTVDTAVGFANLVTQGNLGTGDLQDQWHKSVPESDNPLVNLTRKLSGIVVPNLLIPGAVIPRLAALPIATKIPGATKFLGEVALRLGVDTTVVASSTSATDDNIAKAFGDTFGWYAPWATKDGDSPDVRRWKQLSDGFGFSLGLEAIGGIFRYRSAIANAIAGDDYLQASRLTLQPKVATRWDTGAVVIPQTDEAAEALAKATDDLAEQTKSFDLQDIDDQIDALGPLDELGEEAEQELARLTIERSRIQVDEGDWDPVTSMAQKARHARDNALQKEAVEIMADDPDGALGHNPIVNDPAQAQQRGITAAEGDIPGAILDHDRIINQINVDNGRARAALPTDGMRDLVKARNATARGDFLEEFGARIPRQVDAIYEGKWTRSAAELNASVDSLVQKVYDMVPAEFADMLNTMKTNIQESYNSGFLSDEAFVEASQAFRRVFDDMFDPQKMRASVLGTQQAADSIETSAHAAILLDDAGLDTTRQMDNALSNMELLNQEIRANRFLWGYQGQMMQFAKSKNPLVAKKMQRMVEEFDANLIEAKARGAEVIQTLKDINKHNPEYLDAFKKAYDLSGGDVDELYKLHRWAENNIGLIKKGFIDMNPEVPSLVMQGIHGVQFNGLLNGLAPSRALIGNSLMLIGKPVSILAGAAVRGRYGDIKRGLHIYGGVVENFQNALKYAAKEWNYVRTNPEMAMLRGRADISFAQSHQFEVMESMAEGWRKNNQHGKLFMLNWARLMSSYNNNQYFRWGVNALHTIDGFTNSMLASATARANAYDDLLAETNGVWDEAKFLQKSDDLYRGSFDETGLLTNEAAKHAASEIALNLDNRIARSIETIVDHVPALKPLFRFPRTGVNATELAWSFNPVSGLDMAIGKARQVFKATSKAEKIEALQAHGISEFSDIAFETLKNEYRGRQSMGQLVALSAGMYAAGGNITGNGPSDAQERRDMEALGVKFNSIRNPFTGEWHSHQGLEPYSQILNLVGDIHYQSTRVDSSIAEDWWLKLAWSMSANVSNSTFLSGLQPLVSLLGRDETAWKRFVSDGHINPTVPFAWAGLRSILSKAITPQLKDVDNEIQSFLMNRNKFLFPGNDNLKDQIDVYTGDRINYTDPMTSAINSVLPIFKSNGGMEPWRQWLIGTGWDGLHTMRMNPNIPGKKLDRDERWFVNTWIAQNAGLKEQIQALMKIDQNPQDKRSLTYYRQHLQQHGQEKFPIGKTFIHDKLTEMHNTAFRLAFKELELQRKEARPMGLLEHHKRDQMEHGEYDKALTTQEQIDELIRLQKPLN